MIFFCYYFVIGIFVLITFEVNLDDAADLMQNVLAYFACEQDGLPNSCKRDGYFKYVHIYMSNISYVLLSLLIFFHLIYVINWKYVIQKFCKKQPNQAQVMLSDEQNSSSFTPNPMEAHGSSFTSTLWLKP